MGFMKIQVVTRSGARVLPDGILLSDQATVDDLKSRFAELKPKYYPSRQRWTLPTKENTRSGEVLTSGKKLSEYGIKDGVTLQFKDLGPQIGYATVFFWEYFGPLVIYPLFYFLPSIAYAWHTGPAKHSLTQTLALSYWCFHYTKRILETFFVHKFSHSTMPLANLYRNCAYYWLFAGYVAYFINHPFYTAPPVNQTHAAFAVAITCQLFNLVCHIMLAGLRTGSSSGYVIPRGFLFEYITAPNYTTEICGWVSFTIATQSLPAALFTFVGAAQMGQWALAKHARLRQLFDGRDGRPKYPRRWIMLPPLF